jgi:PKD repeat protein
LEVRLKDELIKSIIDNVTYRVFDAKAVDKNNSKKSSDLTDKLEDKYTEDIPGQNNESRIVVLQNSVGKSGTETGITSGDNGAGASETGNNTREKGNNNTGEKDNTNAEIISQKPVPALPAANFNADPISGFVPLDVQFTDQSLDANSWDWNFGDGNTSTLQSPKHIYTAAGNFTVNLTVNNVNGMNSSLATINVSHKPVQVLPVANFNADPISGFAPLDVQFTNQSLDANSWDWNFGDGNTSTLQSPRHTFFTSGTYAVNLTVRNENGTNSKIAKITVSQKPVPALPVANFDADPISGFAPLEVQFTDQSLDTNSWDWNFGDGNTSTLQNPKHIYTEAGNFTVNLTVNSENGMNSSLATINVSQKPLPVLPMANFTSNITQGYAPLFVQFNDISTGAPAKWDWDFGDGVNSTQQNTLHIYTATGNFTVNLTVSNENGTNSSLTKINVL